MIPVLFVPILSLHTLVNILTQCFSGPRICPHTDRFRFVSQTCNHLPCSGNFIQFLLSVSQVKHVQDSVPSLSIGHQSHELMVYCDVTLSCSLYLLFHFRNKNRSGTFLEFINSIMIRLKYKCIKGSLSKKKIILKAIYY